MVGMYDEIKTEGATGLFISELHDQKLLFTSSVGLALGFVEVPHQLNVVVVSGNRTQVEAEISLIVHGGRMVLEMGKTVR